VGFGYFKGKKSALFSLEFWAKIMWVLAIYVQKWENQDCKYIAYVFNIGIIFSTFMSHIIWVLAILCVKN
jgi:hypothetical protein